MIPGLAGRTAGSALFQKSNCGPVSAEEKLVWSTCCLPGGPLGTAGEALIPTSSYFLLPPASWGSQEGDPSGRAKRSPKSTQELLDKDVPDEKIY